MHRQRLSNELPYQFRAPRPSRLWVRLTRPARRWLLRTQFGIEDLTVEGLHHLAPLLRRGDGVLLAPNHCDRADGLVMLGVADRLGRPLCAMAAHQTFEGEAGLRRWLFPRLGIFPVDREGADLSAFKAAVEVLTRGEHPLLVFPEGEVYHLADRLTVLREGPAVMALTAAKRLGESGRTAWVVPVGLKYRFVAGHDPTPALLARLAELEGHFTWWPKTEGPPEERVYRFGEAALALKELEYLGATRNGPLPHRIATLREHLLSTIEARRLGPRHPADAVPARVRDLRRSCLDVLSDPGSTAVERAQARHDLNDIFVALQCYSYPGDYVRECPTPERIAETLMKLQEDVLGVETAPPPGPRRAIVHLGAPIDARGFLDSCPRPRQVAPALTAALEAQIQGLLDAIGPRPSTPEARRGRSA